MGSKLREISPILIESTCNQVNQYGGYSGMTPAAFYRYVVDIANSQNLHRGKLILGGDHLGPFVWKDELAETAMHKAEALVHDYVEAGFSKIHIDTSMHLAGDNTAHPLNIELIAHRTAQLVKIAEETWIVNPPQYPPRYVIASEVPTPGGVHQNEDCCQVTSPNSVRETIEATRRAFIRKHPEEAWERVTAVVVQPGVVFGESFIHDFIPEKAISLSSQIEAYPNLVYEVHSTDYQTRQALQEMVRMHFAILKVGPALTFAFREMVFALALIEKELFSGNLSADRSNIIEAIEEAMQKVPNYWQGYYHGTSVQQVLARKYSLSERIRYYWTVPNVESSLNLLINN
jgi:D-tagatose-1,6-bisphosphate aldolase subunit GatZ/KbaZ